MNKESTAKIKDFISEELGVPVGGIQFLSSHKTGKIPSTESQEFLEALAIKIHKTHGIPENRVRRTIKDFKRWWDKQPKV